MTDGFEPTAVQGQLVANLLAFARTLRSAGMPVGPGKILAAIDAIRTVGIAERSDFYWTLHAVLVNQREQRKIFDQAFHVFWRNPHLLERLLTIELPGLTETVENPADEPLLRRLAEALNDDSSTEITHEQRETDASATWSNLAGLKEKDFEQMSQAELMLAKALLRRLQQRTDKIATRRFRAATRGERIDLRNTLRRALRSGSDMIALQRKTRLKRTPTLVLLCDVSGSMSRYSRMLLHYAHTLSSQRERVHTFVFGIQLSNITRQLRFRDVDQALDEVASVVNDWEGGTSIGTALHTFNRDWSRRVLGQGADVLFISDGLDREGSAQLGAAMERLHKSCRRLIWLNPLLRYDGFQPRAVGIRTLLPHVDEFRPAHNLNSLLDLAELLARPIQRKEEGISEWLHMMH